MPYAADLHLHSRFASGVSPNMTLEAIALWARRKGIDVIGTADCLQPQWSAELEQKLEEAEPGWFALSPEIDDEILLALPPLLRLPLRFVLSTEVCCAPSGSDRVRGVHHLLYFPSFDSLRKFQRHAGRYGDLTEGRPTLRLTSRQLLQMVCDHGDDCHMAPAHVLNPYFASLGTIERRRTLAEWFGDLTPRLLAAETGLNATPTMCRRVSDLDQHALFSCSDAHSLEKIGRECTLVEAEPGYAGLFEALRDGSDRRIAGLLKVPLLHARYYLNLCQDCTAYFESSECPRCGRRLLTGARDRLEQIADREEAVENLNAPPVRHHLPLKPLLSRLCGSGPASQSIARIYERLLARAGHERFILTEASEEVLASASTGELARAILAQREQSELSGECGSASVTPLGGAQMQFGL